MMYLAVKIVYIGHNLIYSLDDFKSDIEGLVDIKDKFKLNSDIEEKLIGTLDHPSFFDQGEKIKEIFHLLKEKKFIKMK